ncbi:HEPN domain-containing protein [Dermatobacter hominis]|uniref:HEPN domain-containing protein n=1 Tax=Dermatobacter hominis TaxID=2884263 RepID=UPI001D11C734|nr:HEPN domain-containing protein [Dermatobacter hominis]UDY34031.1 hypothetical protein LH044_11815 [Dermatobacter hominis]
MLAQNHHRGIEGDGWFWRLDGDEDDAKPGRLTAHLGGSITLELSTPMLTEARPWPSTSNDVRSACAIYGLVGSTRVTLLGARVAGLSQTSTTALADRERLDIDTAVIGAHLPVIGRRDRTVGVITDALLVEFELLETWLGRRGIHIEMRGRSGDDRFTSATVQFDYPDTLTAPIDGGHLELQTEWTPPTYDEDVVGVRTGTLLRVILDSPRDVDEAIHHAASVQLLLALLTSAAPDVLNLRLHHPDRRAGQRGDLPLYDPVALVYRWSRRRPEQQSAPLTSPFSDSREALLDFEELGGIDALAAWTSIANELHLILSLLTSAAFVERLPHENAFLNVTSAAEGLHRHWYPVSKDDEKAAKRWVATILNKLESLPRDDRQRVKGKLKRAHEPSLERRLRELADRLPLTAAALTDNDVSTWSAAVAWVRNQLAHPNSPAEVKEREERGLYPASGFEYLFLAHSVYWLTTAALVAELGVSDALIAERISDHELHWKNQRAHDAVSRWRRDDEAGVAGFVRPGDDP